jgi:2,3-bisphosphoglycerate-independent phosphoglycerate mutase
MSQNIKGFSKLSGMDVYSFDYPKLKDLDVYQNLNEGLKKACDNAISCVKKKKNFDYIYLHIKETDLPGHDNKPLEKVKMIEYIDKTLFKFLYNLSKSSEIKIVVSGDHSTPCKLKAHSSDPIPVLYYDSKRDINSKKRFDESYCVNGSLGRFDGKDLFKIVGFK